MSLSEPDYFPGGVTPTSAQREILRSDARVTVVKACPGSGKTTVFAAMVRRWLSEGLQGGAGLAALSFTNVAEREITAHVGDIARAPHFIGTLDSFILRFILRPFGHLVGLPAAGARLIPPPLDGEIERPAFRHGQNAADEASIFTLRFVSGTLDKPVLGFPLHFRSATLDEEWVEGALNQKRQSWAKSGLITHSDSHYLAARILTDPEFGPQVRDLLTKRFPVILVDEFQDTGAFLGQCVEQLLRHPEVKALVVGDPDQAIYEFGGSDPGLFDRVAAIPGAVTLPLDVTQRCSHVVSSVISVLSPSKREVKARAGAPNGSVIIISHKSPQPVITAELRSKLNSVDIPLHTCVVLARRGNTCRHLTTAPSMKGGSNFKGGSRRTLAALEELMQGSSRRASLLTDRTLGRLLLDADYPSIALLSERGVEPRNWRLAKYRFVKRSYDSLGTSTWGEWAQALKDEVRAIASQLDLSVSNSNLGAAFRIPTEKKNLTSTTPSVQQEVATLNTPEAMTVHAAKGRGFPNVLFYAPKPSKRFPCPSQEWWDGDLEERRVAYVALSRAQQNVVLCLHSDTVQSLVALRPEFVAHCQLLDAEPS
jgi:DNA helicase-2/ATP-dependent DNA helicase PcrA